MRFSAVHKASTYLVAIAAFLSVALSGELDVATTLLGLGGLAASWYFEPPRVRLERWSGLFTALALGVFAFTVLSMLSGEAVILAGARFLVYLLLIKLFNRRVSRDYQQIYLLSFLLLTTGTAINTGMSYAVCFLAFVIFATWALILFHLRREMEDNFLLKHSDDASSEKVEVERILNSRRIVGPAFLAGTSGVSLVIFISAVLMFILFPRVGFGLFFQHSRSGVSVAGFSEQGVELGGHGLIRDDTTVVMRVKLGRSDGGDIDIGSLHWRGVAFDHYERGRWSRDKTKVFKNPLSGATSELFSTEVLLAIGGRTADPGRARRGLHQEIYIDPLDTNVLFAVSTPLMLQVKNLGVGRNQKVASIHAGDEVRLDREQGIAYEAWSDPDPPPVALLQAARDVDPKAMKWEPYLQIPAEIRKTTRIHDRAVEITRDARGPYEKTVAIHAYLLKNYTYTLEMDTDDDYEPLDYFLFERKMGHCEYFSSAMSILLREVGVPTRNVNGFLGGEWNEYGGYVAVRGGDAHSWVEVWFDGVGWVTWDPTPPAAMARGDGWLDSLRRLMDTLRLQWFKWVIEYDLSRQINLFKGIGKALRFGGGKLSMKAVRVWVREHKVGVAGGVIGLLGVYVLFSMRNRRKQTPAQRAARRVSRDPVVQLYARTAAWLGRRGYKRPPAQTPREHARTLGRGPPGAEPAFRELTELYYLARFDGSGASLDRARELAEQVRAAFARARKS